VAQYYRVYAVTIRGCLEIPAVIFERVMHGT